MLRVFISYASGDADFAENMSNRLTSNGFEVWRDEGSLHAGDDWRKAIDEGLLSSDAILIVLSERSAASSYVTYEWAFALGNGSAIIPILLEEKAGAHPRLAGLQHLDFSKSRLRPWEELFSEVRRCSARNTRADRRREADAVLQLATDLYVTKLMRQFERNLVGGGGLGTAPPGLKPTSQTVRSFYAFGEMVHYDSAVPSDEAVADLGNLIGRIAGLRKRREGVCRAATLDLFFAVHGEADSIARSLSGVRLGDRTLDVVWEAAMKRVAAYWQENVPGISYFHGSEINRLRQFIEEHPAYSRVGSEGRKALAAAVAVGDLTIEHLAVSTRDQLESFLEEGLDRLDTRRS